MYNPEDENEPPESAALPPERAVASSVAVIGNSAGRRDWTGPDGYVGAIRTEFIMRSR
jgi:hypothetical protein